MKPTSITRKKTNRLRYFLAALTGLLLFMSQPEPARAQFEDVDFLLSSASIGGTRGYRLRRIGANSPSASVNGSYVYYPASSIKVLQHFYAMNKVEEGDWSLLGTTMDVCSTSTSNCGSGLNQSAGCNSSSQNLSTTLQQMMRPSSNRATNAIQEQIGIDFWPAGAPFSNDRAGYGQISLTQFAQNTLGMSNSAISQKFGCSGACAGTPNTLTAVDMEKLYRNIANNGALLSIARRMELHDLMINESNSSWLMNIIDEEAADLEIPHHAAAFKAKFYQIRKGGSWTCGNGDGFYSNAGLIQLPTYNGTYKRLFTWASFIDNTQGWAYNGATHTAANEELLRWAIRGALLTWSGANNGGFAIGGIATDLAGIQQGYGASSPEYYFIGQALQELGGVSNLYCPACDSTMPTLRSETYQGFADAIEWLEMIPAQTSATGGTGSATGGITSGGTSTTGVTVIDSILPPPIDSTEKSIAELGLRMYRDCKALLVSAGDGPRYETAVASVDNHLGNAEDFFNRGEYVKAMEECVAGARMARPLVNLGQIDVLLGDQTLGFAPVDSIEVKFSTKQDLAPSGAMSLEAAPNPFRNEVQLQISVETAGPASLKIYDLQGREVAQLFDGSLQKGEQRSFTWNPESLPDGLYFGRLTTEHGAQHQKLILQR